MSEKKVEGLTIDWETADRITVHNLKDHLKMITEDVEKLETLMNEGDLAEYQQKDYMYNVGMLKAMKKVLVYFGEK